MRECSLLNVSLPFFLLIFFPLPDSDIRTPGTAFLSSARKVTLILRQEQAGRDKGLPEICLCLKAMHMQQCSSYLV